MIDVLWLSLHDDIRARGYADQCLLEELMAGTLWRAPGHPTFRHHEGGFDALPADAPGAVVVIPARWHVQDADRIATWLYRLGWALVILTGDEEGVFPRHKLANVQMRRWVQTPVAGSVTGTDRPLGDGWAWSYREHLPADPLDKPLNWFFAGQISHRSRQELAGALSRRRRGDGRVIETAGFMEGVDIAEYAAGMVAAKVAPCPAGPQTPDTFRLFEALEAGCIPIVESPEYWQTLFGDEHPLPVLRSWTDIDQAIDELVREWPANANRIFAWWQHHKRELAYALRDDLVSVRQTDDSEPTVDDRITVLIPTSPIPSHPDTSVIEQTVASVRERLPRAEILVMVDGVRAEQEGRRADYAEYTRRLLWLANNRWRNVLPVLHDEHLHQAEMTRRVLDLVRTPAILFVEHDTPLFGEQLPWQSLLDGLQEGTCNLIRLHHEASILEPHRHLVLDAEPHDVAGAPLLRTVQWSQRPHLARTDFYRDMLTRFFGREARTMIEDSMYGVLVTHWQEYGYEGWERFRTWIYAPSGDMKRSTHLDGREGESKYEMRWAYDTPMVPFGAPNPHRDVPAAYVAPREISRAIRVGLFGARADRRGLAVQTSELARHLQPAKVFGIDMGDLSPYPCSWREYNPATLAVARHDRIFEVDVRNWLADLDVVLGCETFYLPWFTRLCADMKIHTILVANYEFTHHILAPDWAPIPDVLAVPTTWNMERLPDPVLLPHGVDRQRLPYRQRTEAKTFLHVIGHPAAHDRAGTRVLWEALGFVSQPMHVVVRSMQPCRAPMRYGAHIDLEVHIGDMPDYWQLYDDTDVLVLPRRYGGQSLPMNEALSSGLVVLMPDAEPQRQILPPGMRLPCQSRREFNSLVGPIPLHDVSPRDLARRMDELAARPAEVASLSAEADRIAAGISWDVLIPHYEELFARLATRAAA